MLMLMPLPERPVRSALAKALLVLVGIFFGISAWAQSRSEVSFGIVQKPTSVDDMVLNGGVKLSFSELAATAMAQILRDYGYQTSRALGRVSLPTFSVEITNLVYDSYGCWTGSNCHSVDYDVKGLVRANIGGREFSEAVTVTARRRQFQEFYPEFDSGKYHFKQVVPNERVFLGLLKPELTKVAARILANEDFIQAMQGVSAPAQVASTSTEIDKLRKEIDELRTQRIATAPIEPAKTVAPQAPSQRVLKAHALVIGNSAYAGSAKLSNPINDAKAIGQKLRSLGFTVTLVSDAPHKTTR